MDKNLFQFAKHGTQIETMSKFLATNMHVTSLRRVALPVRLYSVACSLQVAVVPDNWQVQR